MSARFVLFGAFVLSVASATPASANSCDLDGKEAAFKEARRQLRLQSGGAQLQGQWVDIAVRRSTGNIEIYRGYLNGVDEAGNVRANIGGQDIVINKATDLRVSKGDGRPSGLLEIRGPGASEEVLPQVARGQASKGDRVRDADVASGEVDVPNQYGYDYYDRPRGGPIATRGPDSYVTLSDGKHAKVSRIWTDDRGIMHIEVLDVPAKGKNLGKPRELDPLEAGKAKPSPAAKKAFAKFEDEGLKSSSTGKTASGEIHAANHYDHDRVRVGGDLSRGDPGQVIGTRGDESYVSYRRTDAQGRPVDTQAKVSRIWQDEKGEFHVEIFESPRDGKGLSRHRELTPDEVATLRHDPGAKGYLGDLEEADIVARDSRGRATPAFSGSTQAEQVDRAVAATKGETLVITTADGSRKRGQLVKIPGTKDEYIFSPGDFDYKKGNAIITSKVRAKDIKGIRKATDHMRDELADAISDGKRVVIETKDGLVSGRIQSIRGDEVDIATVGGGSVTEAMIGQRVKLRDVKSVRPEAAIAKAPPKATYVAPPRAQSAPGTATPRYRRIRELPREPIGDRKLAVAVKGTKGKSVVVTTKDGSVMTGSLVDMGGGRTLLRPKNGYDGLAGTYVDGDVVTGVKLADDHYADQAAIAKKAGDRVEVMTSNGPVTGTITKVDDDGVMIEVLGGRGRKGEMEFKRVDFSDMSDMRAIDDATADAVDTAKVATARQPRGKNTGQNGEARRQGRAPTQADSVSGEIDSPDQYDLDQSYLPHNGQKVSTRGDDSYVSYGAKGKESDAKITRIWTDDEGNLHVEVMDPPRSGSAVRPRELEPQEIATLQSKKDAKKTFEEVEDDVGGRNGPSIASMNGGEPAKVEVDTKPIRVRGNDPAQQATVDANLEVVRGDKFYKVWLKESSGGNAGPGQTAVNVILDQDGRIVEVGNFQNFSTDVQKKIKSGTYTQGTFSMKAFGNKTGKDYEFIESAKLNPKQRKVMDAVEDRLNVDATAKRARAHAESRLSEAGYPKDKLKNLTDKQAEDFAAGIDHIKKIDNAAKAADEAEDSVTAEKFRSAAKDYKNRLDEALKACF